MDNEKILLCYRDDKEKKPKSLNADERQRVAAAIPCVKTIWKFSIKISKKKIKKQIRDIYEKNNAGYLWLDTALCRYLKIKTMPLPHILMEKWVLKVPFFHTLIFGDDKEMNAFEYISKRTDKLASLIIVCYDEFYDNYEKLAAELFQTEGIILQILTYEELKRNKIALKERMVIKGRTAVLDFEERRSFWRGQVENTTTYYSFLLDNRLFLDTCRKNRYNTLTK